MRKWKRYFAIILGALLLMDTMPVYGAELNPRGTIPNRNVTDENAEDEDVADGTITDENQWYDYYLYLDTDKWTFVPGEKYKLQIQTDAPREELVLESENPQIATVSKDGVITAVSGGAKGRATVRITAKWTNPANEFDTVSSYVYITVENTLKLNKTSYTIYTGQKNTTYRLKAVASPKGKVTWKSSNEKIATVDAKGIIKPKKSGKVKITAAANGVTATCNVTVKKPYLKLASKATVYLKNPQKLNFTVAPKAAIKWKSSNKRIVKVNANGLVTGLKTGTATITAKVHGVTKKCKVTVKKPSITLSGYNSSWNYKEKYTVLCKGSTTQLTAMATPAVRVKWRSSNKKVAEVDTNGVVTAVRTGTTTITASIGGARASWKVKVIKESPKLTFSKRTMMVGKKALLSVKNAENIGYINYAVTNFETAYGNSYYGLNLSTDGKSCTIEAVEKGKGTITVTGYLNFFEKEYYTAIWNQKCTVTVKDSGISDTNFSVAKGTKRKLELVNVGENVAKVQWSSTAPKIASVHEKTGVVTGKKTGAAQIKAVVTYADGRKKTYTSSMKVSNPTLSTTTVAVALNGEKAAPVKGMNTYSSVKWETTKKSVVGVSSSGMLVPQKKGKAVIKATVDGKVLRFTVYVSNPQMKESYALLGAGKTAKISVTGLSKKSKVTYKSKKPGVVSVTKKGVVTAKTGGRAEILVTADGKEFTYVVECASEAAINACINGKSILDVSTYSQANRMQDGFYDCSSLVFKAYGRNSALLGGTSHWAPTAAGMAAHMANTGKVIAWQAVPLDSLRPGDLIFYGMTNNGRYLGIYHVSMYYGNGCRLEIGMSGYFEQDNIVMIARPVP